MDIIPKYMYFAILMVSLLITVGLVSGIVRRHAFPGRAPFLAMLSSVFVLILITILQLRAADDAAVLYWATRAVIPGSFIAPFWCMFALRFARADRHLSVTLVALLLAIPALTSLSVLLGMPQEAVFARSWLVPTPVGSVMEYKGGPLFWIMTYYVYIVFFAGTAIFLRTSFRLHRMYLRQTITLVLAALIPFIVDFFFLFNIGGLPRVNLLPVAVSVSALIITLNVDRFRLFRTVPIAHGLLFRNLTDGAVVVDFEGHVVEVNQSATVLLGLPMDAVGSPAIATLRSVPNIDLLLKAQDMVQEEVEFASPEPLWASIAVVPLKDRRGRLIGRLLTVRDVTHQKRVQQEQERLLAELQEALNSVRTLQHLLPICAGCKKIRDDKGYWTQVEAYVTEHTHARFSHGVCPECFALLAPGDSLPADPRSIG